MNNPEPVLRLDDRGRRVAALRIAGKLVEAHLDNCQFVALATLAKRPQVLIDRTGGEY